MMMPWHEARGCRPLCQRHRAGEGREEIRHVLRMGHERGLRQGGLPHRLPERDREGHRQGRRRRVLQPPEVAGGHRGEARGRALRLHGQVRGDRHRRRRRRHNHPRVQGRHEVPGDRCHVPPGAGRGPPRVHADPRRREERRGGPPHVRPQGASAHARYL